MAARNAAKKSAKAERAATRRKLATTATPPDSQDEIDEEEKPAPRPKGAHRVRGASIDDVNVRGTAPVTPGKKPETAKERRARLKKIKPTKVVAIARGYYGDRLWEVGEKFDMVIDPTLEPPKWVKALTKGAKKKVEEDYDEDEQELEDEDAEELDEDDSDDESDEDEETDEDDEEI